MHELFTYGTLRCEDIMYSIAGQCHKPATALLRDYRCLAVKNEHYPGIVKTKGFSVTGRVYSGISNAALLSLDHFEGEMYQRALVEVDFASGVKRSVFAYVVREEFRHCLAASDWDFEEFLRTGKEAFWRRC